MVKVYIFTYIALNNNIILWIIKSNSCKIFSEPQSHEVVVSKASAYQNVREYLF